MIHDPHPRFDLATAPLSIASVTLVVRDLPRMVHFYRDVIGLTVLDSTATATTLGTERPLLTLQLDTGAEPQNSRTPGLFHTAFLVPDRADLGTWLRHAASYGVFPYGASDHNVSEALYLDDPEGNGIELYADRPVTAWTDADGALHMPSLRLDLASLSARSVWRAAPRDMCIGHVHLRTTDIPAAEAFWTALGMEVTARYPGASFFGAGGYHHQIAANVWTSGGQPPRRAGMAGLSALTIAADVAAPQVLEAPSGVRVTLTPKGAHPC
ncbi:VOC family protein [Pseudaestuariivita sp.]|uniref:VOC family protein n=1 Tax=Pseudaestuariivita sp. TaxID=2211669 RepID=UPI00405877F5